MSFSSLYAKRATRQRMRLAMRECRLAAYTRSKGPRKATPASAGSVCAAPSAMSSSARTGARPRGHGAKKYSPADSCLRDGTDAAMAVSEGFHNDQYHDGGEQQQGNLVHPAVVDVRAGIRVALEVAAQL